MTKGQKDEAKNEADLMERLTHPNIVKYHRQFEKNQKLNIVMELCENGNLRKFLNERKNQRIDEDKILKLFKGIAEGLQKLHNEGIMHRDLKPENIFMTWENQAKIGDLGIAKKVDLTLHNTCGIGT